MSSLDPRGRQQTKILPLPKHSRLFYVCVSTHTHARYMRKHVTNTRRNKLASQYNVLLSLTSCVFDCRKRRERGIGSGGRREGGGGGETATTLCQSFSIDMFTSGIIYFIFYIQFRSQTNVFNVLKSEHGFRLERLIIHIQWDPALATLYYWPSGSLQCIAAVAPTPVSSHGDKLKAFLMST